LLTFASANLAHYTIPG